MISDKEWFLVSNILVPDPQFRGSYQYDSFEWTDIRPYPSQADIDEAGAEFQRKETKADTIKNAHAVYYASLEAGYTDNVGVTWYCNERATMDLAMMVVLNNLDEKEPVYILSMSDGVREMTYEQFKVLAVEIGRHAYEIRQTLWTTILHA